ncbi:biotin carboxylase N-terminal domain-containing protein [Nocardioides sp. R-C-SC26]|uniref:acetyl/propionyl/methylcrotonyl-CoA carboxylase subunit alpha n=1 Tax=Nocardioides sp. R-C-SC26 TaxID=2870414 RepID=UPI001E649587|nr:biotin carboxylase N-terminal domain-containing protein [Nocardioides sp. R-C-SC26]
MTGPISALLIANRGEIARRVIRTCRRLGITAVAIYTDADAAALHVREADRALRVPSYLDVEAVVAAAVEAGADAVHPGYGFLSERAPFARALEAAGVTLVGPSADVMDQMGRKDAARAIAVAAGVPVIPAYDLDDDPTSFTYPVLVKAAAGGGGKGMRVVRSAEQFAEALASAQGEARRSFGDDVMLVETYVESGRHIEVQVVGDAHGTVLHFHERDCSAQRRHQKVLEEAPAPTLDDATRARICAAAVDLASHVGYTGAGTVEFLYDQASGDFYFLEMNTRLQVEHPVTELITGVDLVQLQLRVAAGEPIGLAQSDVVVTGHAVEARVYAEDAFAGFLPQAGRASWVRWPEQTWSPDPDPGRLIDLADGEDPAPQFGVRVDHALESGQIVTPAFDPMLGKVIAWASGREEALMLLTEALERTAVMGLTTNVAYLAALVDHDDFRQARHDTAWLDRLDLPRPDDGDALAFAEVTLRTQLRRAPRGPWEADGFRAGGPAADLVEHGRTLPSRAGTHGGFSVDGDVVHGGFRGWGAVRRSADGTEIVHRGHRVDLGPHRDRSASLAAGDGTVAAPMPGTVLDIRVAVGEEVVEGQALGAMEAMKMELTLRAPFDGVVTAVPAVAGGQVPLGAVLLEIEPHEGAGSGAS